MSLEQRVALVSGGSRGLGRELSLALADQGATVGLCSRDPESLRETQKELQTRGAQSLAMVCDVSDPEQVQSFIDQVAERYGRIDILVNNAAVASSNLLLEELPPEEWAQALQVNLSGPFHLCRAVIPWMRHQQWGRIVNISSALSVLDYPQFGAYSVSKAGLNTLTKILARELEGSGVLVNGVDPGAFRSGMNPDLDRGPEIAVEDVLRLASVGDDGPTGRFFRDGIELGW